MSVYLINEPREFTVTRSQLNLFSLEWTRSNQRYNAITRTLSDTFVCFKRQASSHPNNINIKITRDAEFHWIADNANKRMHISTQLFANDKILVSACKRKRITNKVKSPRLSKERLSVWKFFASEIKMISKVCTRTPCLLLVASYCSDTESVIIRNRVNYSGLFAPSNRSDQIRLVIEAIPESITFHDHRSDKK